MDLNLYHNLWRNIHRFALSYEKNPSLQSIEKAKMYYYAMAKELHCSVCREHYEKWLKKLCLKNRKCLFQWSVKMHNKVNEKNNKPILSVKDAKKIWMTAS